MTDYMEMLIETYSATDLIIALFFLDWLKNLKIGNLRVSKTVMRNKLDEICNRIYEKYPAVENDKFIDIEYRQNLISQSIQHLP